MVDRERKKRNREIRIILTDILMAVSVIAIVTILVCVVAGWRFNEDMTLEQNGLVQIESEPTGATVVIDGETQLASTNMSKMLTGGEHEIVLTKKGYESWSKKVVSTPGWLLNLKYPRLFKQDREKEIVAEMEKLIFLKMAPDRKSLVYSTDDSKIWNYVTDLGSGEIKTMALDFSTIEDFPQKFEPEKFIWNKDGTCILVKTKQNDWLMINLKTLKETKNINELVLEEDKEAKISDVKLANDSGTEIYVLADGLVSKIKLNDEKIEKLPLYDVADFAVYDSKIIFVSKPDEDKLRTIGVYKEGEKTPTDIYTSEVASDILHVGLSEYYGKKYVIFSVGPRLYVYRGDDFPSSNVSEMKLMAENDTSIVPKSLEVSTNGEFFVLRDDKKVVVYDAEVEKYTEYTAENNRTEWLDNYILYGVKDGKFLAWDFDGTNVRTLVVDDAVSGFDATINSNNKYFYYVAKTKSGFVLRREKL